MFVTLIVIVTFFAEAGALRAAPVKGRILEPDEAHPPMNGNTSWPSHPPHKFALG